MKIMIKRIGWDMKLLIGFMFQKIIKINRKAFSFHFERHVVYCIHYQFISELEYKNLLTA